MPKNQLFKSIPDLQIVQSVLEAFGLDNIEDTRLFTKEHMQDVETVQKLTELIPTLKEYIDIQGYYEIIRLCDLKTLQNILNKIDTQWKHIQKTINSKKYNTYTLNCSCNTYVEFDDNLIEFINNNKVIAIMCINIICSYCINL